MKPVHYLYATTALVGLMFGFEAEIDLIMLALVAGVAAIAMSVNMLRTSSSPDVTLLLVGVSAISAILIVTTIVGAAVGGLVSPEYVRAERPPAFNANPRR